MAAKPKTLKERFASAKLRAEQLDARPSSQTLLDLYSFYKQATQGDVSGARPGLLDLTGRAKFDAWTRRKGLSKEAAMKGYVDLVEELEAAQGD